jgi:arsenical pump membrane protein
VRRLSVLDRVSVALLGAGALCVATGALPGDATRGVLDRTWPLLLFLITVVVLAELTAQAQVFDVIAARIAILAGGSYPLLFLLCVAFAALTTTVLNLDTTAVLLTPVMLALAGQVGIAPVPLAMTTVWLANTASLLLPVSNLTNLLAQDRLGLDPLGFAARMWPAQLASVAVTMACLWIFSWRRRADRAHRYDPPPPHEPPDRVLFVVAGAAVVVFVAMVLAVNTPLWVASGVAMLMVVAVFAVRRRESLSWRLPPYRLLAFVSGLFLVIETLSRHGLDTVMRALIGDDPFRAAAAGGLLANLVNNLPAYLAGESVIPGSGGDADQQLLALLIGVGVAPLVTPWGSLATLLWYERCRAWGVRVPVARFALTGLVPAVTGTAAAVAALVLFS